MRQTCRDAPDRCEPVFAPDVFLHRANLGQILKCENQTGRLARLGEQRRNCIADAHGKAFGRQHVGFKTRRRVARVGRLQRVGNRQFDISEQGENGFAAHLGGFLSGNFGGGLVERVNVSVQIGCNQTRTNRFDDALVQHAQIGERLGRSNQFIARSAAISQARGEQADDQKRDVMKRDDLHGAGKIRRHAERIDDRQSGQHRQQGEQNDANRRHQNRFSGAQEKAGDGDADDVERDIRRR